MECNETLSNRSTPMLSKFRRYPMTNKKKWKIKVTIKIKMEKRIQKIKFTAQL